MSAGRRLTDEELVDYCARLTGSKAALARRLGKAKSTVSGWGTREAVPADVRERMEFEFGLKTSGSGAPESLDAVTVMLRQLHDRTGGHGWSWIVVVGVIEMMTRLGSSAPKEPSDLGAD